MCSFRTLFFRNLKSISRNSRFTWCTRYHDWRCPWSVCRFWKLWSLRSGWCIYGSLLFQTSSTHRPYHESRGHPSNREHYDWFGKYHHLNPCREAKTIALLLNWGVVKRRNSWKDIINRRSAWKRHRGSYWPLSSCSILWQDCGDFRTGRTSSLCIGIIKRRIEETR